MMDEQRGAAEAQSLLEDLGFDTLPISPANVANEIHDDSFAVVMEDQAFNSENILGKAVGSNDGALIYINSNIADPGRYNFTAAHELGHVCMHIMSQKRMSFECGSKEIFYNQYDDPIEREANGFASGLLMPKHLISNLTDGEINWHNIDAIKSSCGTSLEASLRRLITLNKTPVAFLIHEGARFKRFFKSDDFEPFIGKSPLSSDQMSLRTDGLTEDLPTDFETVDAIDWVTPSFKGMTLESIYSSSIALKNNITYTLLSYDDECFE